MTSDARGWQFPAACPRCAAAAGTPARISECTDAVITIVVRCDECAAEWTLTATPAPLILKRKPDRRISN